MYSYDTLNTNALRLWSAMPDQDIDLAKFNEGDYQKALAARHRALEITQVLKLSTLEPFLRGLILVFAYRYSIPTITTGQARSCV